MEQKLGQEKAMVVAKYQGVTSLTQEQATMILKTIWPDAPDAEVVKAALTCQMYGLNPLMRHVYLIPFGNQWSRVLGIGATRLIASRRGSYTYLDGPRLMTEEEQNTIRGEVDRENYWAITVVGDNKGNRAPGYGSYPRKGGKLQGEQAGNTRQNMAFIRSERAALDRLRPGEMPQGFDVVPEEYTPLEQAQNGATEAQGGMIEDKPPPSAMPVQSQEKWQGEPDTKLPSPIDGQAPYGRCPEHGKPLINGPYGPFCPTDIPDGKGGTRKCKGKGQAQLSERK